MEEMITGYQWMPADGKFRCVYEFPNNMDKEEIHMPPFTTLIAPPVMEPGYEAFWTGESWIVIGAPLPEPPGLDYANLMPEYIQSAKDMGIWTPEMEAKYQAAIAAVV